MFYPSNDQKNIYSYCVEKLNESNETIKADVIAPAGSGKSTTIMYLLDKLSYNYNFLYLVFNTDMKKELEQRLSFSTNSFTMINRDNVATYTFHGYLRKILSEKIPEIGFDYKNGKIAETHIKNLFIVNEVNINTNNRYDLVADSFNDYAKDFIKSTMSIQDFLNNKNNSPKFGINEFNALAPLICKKNNISTETLNNFTLNQKNEVIKETYNDFLDDIFEKGLIKDDLPHDIYYKYVHYKYKDLDLFSDYPFVMIDEAQDIDPIIISLLNMSKSNIIKFGDNFQQINRFRGTVSALEDKTNRQFSLTQSYRLSSYLAFLTEAFLKQEAPKFGYLSGDVPKIYGVSRNGLTIENSFFNISTKDVFFENIISELSKIVVKDSNKYIEIEEEKNKIEKSILSGKKTIFKKAVNKFLKDKNKDNLEFYRSILNFTSLFKHKSNEQINKDIDSLENNMNQDLFREIYHIAKSYSLNLSKKEKREILVTDNGSFGYIARNNKKVIDAFYDFVKTIPHDKQNDIPLYNIRFSLTMAETYKMFSKNKFNNIAPKDKAIMINCLKQIPSKMNKNISVWDIYQKIASVKIPEKIMAKLIECDSSADKLVNMKITPNLTLGDFGGTGGEIRSIITNAIKIAKTKSKKEIKELSVNEIIKFSEIDTLHKLVPFENFISTQVDIDSISKENKFNMVTNFYKYIEGIKIVKNNPDVELVNDGAFYNVYFSTGHKVKGLELDNVFIANDIYNIENIENKEEKRDELKLAYVATTRTKKKLTLEQNSPLIDVFNSVIENDYARYYKSENALIKEGLSYCQNMPFPYYEVIFKNDKTIKVDKTITILTPKDFLLPHNDKVVVYDKKEGKADIFIKSEDLLINYNYEYIKPISEEEFNTQLVIYSEEIEEILENAPF